LYSFWCWLRLLIGLHQASLSLWKCAANWQVVLLAAYWPLTQGGCWFDFQAAGQQRQRQQR
jgi:hypothetical protein